MCIVFQTSKSGRVQVHSSVKFDTVSEELIAWCPMCDQPVLVSSSPSAVERRCRTR